MNNLMYKEFTAYQVGTLFNIPKIGETVKEVLISIANFHELNLFMSIRKFIN